MSNATPHADPTPIHQLGQWTIELITALGDLSCFTLRMFGWMLVRMPRGQILWPVMNEVGVLSARSC